MQEKSPAFDCCDSDGRKPMGAGVSGVHILREIQQGRLVSVKEPDRVLLQHPTFVLPSKLLRILEQLVARISTAGRICWQRHGDIWSQQ